MAIRLVLAEDSPFVRAALLDVLETGPGIEVAQACEDLDSLIRAVDAHDPDVVVTDIRMPPTHQDEGIRAAATFRQTRPQMGVVVVSQFVDPRYALDLVEHGSEGRSYLLKEHVHRGGQLLEAVDTVARGGTLIDRAIVEPLVAAHADHPELDLLAAIARGDAGSAHKVGSVELDHNPVKHALKYLAKY
jgi:DNA-binding NarL/FixJ family response regulator